MSCASLWPLTLAAEHLRNLLRHKNVTVVLVRVASELASGLWGHAQVRLQRSLQVSSDGLALPEGGQRRCMRAAVLRCGVRRAGVCSQSPARMSQ
mmetsp:Transcript_13388/g.31431  ORF Transcript_13388/g.31431 Transcript_13388/m.31431 type:complete len:95 (+) Transcript_13388:466-750(+)